MIAAGYDWLQAGDVGWYQGSQGPEVQHPGGRYWRSTKREHEKGRPKATLLQSLGLVNICIGLYPNEKVESPQSREPSKVGQGDWD